MHGPGDPRRDGDRRAGARSDPCRCRGRRRQDRRDRRHHHGRGARDGRCRRLSLMPGSSTSTHYDAQVTWDRTCRRRPRSASPRRSWGIAASGSSRARPPLRDLIMPQSRGRRGHGHRRAARRHRLAVSNPSPIPRDGTPARSVHEPRRSRRAFRGAHRGNGRGSLDPQGSDTRRDARDEAPRRRGDEPRCDRFAASYSPNHSGWGGIPMPSTISDIGEFEALVGAMGGPGVASSRSPRARFRSTPSPRSPAGMGGASS